MYKSLLQRVKHCYNTVFIKIKVLDGNILITIQSWCKAHWTILILKRTKNSHIAWRGVSEWEILLLVLSLKARKCSLMTRKLPKLLSLWPFYIFSPPFSMKGHITVTSEITRCGKSSLVSSYCRNFGMCFLSYSKCSNSTFQSRTTLCSQCS